MANTRLTSILLLSERDLQVIGKCHGRSAGEKRTSLVSLLYAHSVSYFSCQRCKRLCLLHRQTSTAWKFEARKWSRHWTGLWLVQYFCLLQVLCLGLFFYHYFLLFRWASLLWEKNPGISFGIKGLWPWVTIEEGTAPLILNDLSSIIRGGEVSNFNKPVRHLFIMHTGMQKKKKT